MFRDISSILIDTGRIEKRVRELGTQIAADLSRELGGDGSEQSHGQLAIIPVMTGALVFTADLIRQLPLKLSIDVVGVSSYPGKSVESKGAAIRSELPKGLAGKHVLIIDDILDSGQTLDVVTRLIREQSPKSVRSCVLLRKPGKAKVGEGATYVGFDIPDEFVVGYGLDYDGYYRNFPAIATLRPEAR
jgi:hypoxanthine phosphoribosyltransferase